MPWIIASCGEEEEEDDEDYEEEEEREREEIENDVVEYLYSRDRLVELLLVVVLQ